MRLAAPRPALSIVVPVYDEEGNVGPLHEELTQVALSLARPYEIVFVNDGSRDRTLECLEDIVARDPQVRVVDLDGNFGEAAALSAGFEAARSPVVVTLDGDGQNDPHDIPKLLAKLDEGYDTVSGRRRAREGKFVTRVLPSWVANRLIALATRVPVYDCGCGLKAYRREVVAGAQLPRGMNRFLPAILGVRAGRVAEIETKDRPRGSGSSHYGLSRVGVVFRDLFALPLLVRRPAPGHVTAGVCASAAVVLAGLSIAVAWTRMAVPAALLALGAAIAAAIGHNVARFADAQRYGVFRVRRILYGRTAPEHRHRGSRVLGKEPPADIRPSLRRTRHDPLRSRP
jgi:glycosyltransferase involved in cell wall biosynthesis